MHGDARQESAKETDVSKLKQYSKRQVFINDICSRLHLFEHISEDPDENWTIFKDTIHPSAMDSLGQYLANTKTGLMRMTKKSRVSLK